MAFARLDVIDSHAWDPEKCSSGKLACLQAQRFVVDLRAACSFVSDIAQTLTDSKRVAGRNRDTAAKTL